MEARLESSDFGGLGKEDEGWGTWGTNTLNGTISMRLFKAV